MCLYPWTAREVDCVPQIVAVSRVRNIQRERMAAVLKRKGKEAAWKEVLRELA